MTDKLQNQGAELSPEEKRAFLAQRLREKAEQAQTEFPLAYGQRGLWFIHQLAPDSPAYHIAYTVRLHSVVNLKVLENAFLKVVQRHAVLRSTYHQHDGELVQVIHANQEIAFEQIDASGWDEDELYAQIVQTHRKPFDLANGPIVRFHLFTKSPDDHVLLFTVHHIAFDGYSSVLIMQDIALIYEAEVAGRPVSLSIPTAPYTEFVRRQLAMVNSSEGERLKTYWLNQLSGELPTLNLPTDLPRPLMQTYVGSAQPFSFNQEQTTRLKAFAAAEGVTLYVLMLAVFETLLHRYSGQNDVLIGSPASSRSLDFANTAGYFVDPVVLRSKIDDHTTFKTLLGQTRKTVLDAISHQDYPFMLLVEHLALPNDPSRSQLFQVMFNLQTTLRAETRYSNRDNPVDLKAELYLMPHEEGQFDIVFDVLDSDGKLSCWLKYNTEIFQSPTIARMIGHYQTLLNAALANPDTLLADLPLLSDEERHQLLVEWNATQHEYRRDATLHQLFEEQVERTPDAVAVMFEDRILSYRELNTRANQVAYHLRELGVGRDTLVGVCINRSLETLIGILGILKAGGAYVPLDPTYPEDRLAFILEDTQLSIILTLSTLVDRLPKHSARMVMMDAGTSALADYPVENLANQNTSDDLAYVVFTSGSTGKPKGVMAPHRGAVNRLDWMWRTYPFQEGEVNSQKTTLNFVDSVWENFGALLQGVPTVIISEEVVKDPVHFIQTLAEKQVTRLVLVPSLLKAMLESGEIQHATGVKYWTSSGETLPVELLRKFRDHLPDSTLINLYGSSEVAGDVSCYDTSDYPAVNGISVPIGKPIANTQMYILDHKMQPIGVGMQGEIYAGGDGIARGYLKRTELTAEKFIYNPFTEESAARLYETGDLGRYLPDGNIEYLGRVDNQVKLRGFRIELGEIEAALSQQAGVREVVVMVREDIPGDKQLVAYVVGDQRLEGQGLRQTLKVRLPEYMIPGGIIVIEAMPLSPNGKVDRKALPDVIRQASEQDYVAPRTPTEETVMQIWEDVLRTNRIGVHDNFFDVGGHSLKAMQVITRLRDLFGVKLAIRALFDGPTVAELSQVIERERQQGEENQHRTAIRPIARTDKMVVSFAQQRMWLLDQVVGSGAAYNLPGAIRLKGTLDVAALTNSLTEIMRRHEALRTTFEQEGDEVIQHIAEPTAFTMAEFDLQNLQPEEQEAEIERLVSEEVGSLFDLRKGPLVRARLLRLSTEDHIFVVNMHHIVSDGWSTGVFVRELAALYPAIARGEPSPLRELAVQYADYAAWERENLNDEVLAEQISYWTDRLGGRLPVIELPNDRVRPAVPSFNGESHTFYLTFALTKALKRISQLEKVTLFMTLLAAFKMLLWRYSGQQDVIVGTPIANRGRAEIEGLIGFFVNTLALRTDLSGEPSFSELLRRVREVTLDAYAHQDVAFDHLVEILGSGRGNYSPIFQVMFVLQNAPIEALELPGLSLEPIKAGLGGAKFDLALFLREENEQLQVVVEYSTDLFDAATIERMEQHYRNLLDEIVKHPEKRISELSIMSETERHQILIDWNNTSVPYPHDKCIHHLVEEQAARTPDAIAVVFEDQSLTYDQLNRRANQLAAHLRKFGARPDDCIGLYVERSLEMAVALLGIHKAGAAYLPLDPTYPKDRIAFMLEDAQVGLLITQERLENTLSGHQAQVIRIDADWPVMAQEMEANVDSGATPTNLSYVIYTSGSTGKPKGVMIEHRNVMNFFAGMDERIRHQPQAAWLAVTSLSFDISVLEMFWTLARGFKIVIYADRSRQMNPSANGTGTENDYSVGAQIIRHHVTHFQCTPSMAGMLLEDEQDRIGLGQLQQMIVGGEALPVSLAATLRQVVPGDMINMYGPTETTIWSVTHQLGDEGDTIPIGRPIANTTIYLLDERLQPVPVGKAGELYIGGDGVVRGYLNRPELTRERFISDPFSTVAGARLYRTGDLARYRPDGVIEFLGRIDHQVKIRGYRIELGEIEALLDEHPAVTQSVVIAREDVPGDKYLTAYMIPKPGTTPVVTDLRQYLKARLPEFMIPLHYVTLDAFPLTPNAKIDRKALPAPQQSRSETTPSRGVPTTPMEITLANIWQGILRIDDVSVYDNFFDLGGHSLQVMRVTTQLESATGLKLDPVRMRFETLGQIAAFCEALSVEPPPPAAQEESGLPQKLLSSMKRFVRGKI